LQTSQSKPKTIFMIITALLGWFGIVLQFYLILANQTSAVSFWGRFFNFFSFFTVLTNIIVALSLTFSLLKSSGSAGRLFTRPDVQCAIAMYILIVGLVYFFILQKLWQPRELQWVADVTLHYAIPILYTIYWLAFVPKGRVKWTHSLQWLIYPAVYFAYSLIRGAITDWYPYPFIDVKEHGYDGALKNAGILLGVFMIMSFMFISIDKLIARSGGRVNHS
jgi:hypothetical protein